jgi:hypothetical protein
MNRTFTNTNVALRHSAQFNEYDQQTLGAIDAQLERIGAPGVRLTAVVTYGYQPALLLHHVDDPVDDVVSVNEDCETPQTLMAMLTRIPSNITDELFADFVNMFYRGAQVGYDQAVTDYAREIAA